MLAGTTSMQAPFVIAAAGNGDLAALAREHFGALTPLRMTLDDDDALRQVGDGQAAVAVLPIPVEDGHGWWTTLADRRLHIVARLPFWTARPLGAPRGQALVVAGSPPDASGHDRGFLTLESARIGALTEAGLPPRSILRDRGQALVQVDGLLAQDDPRLAGLGRVVVLGGYAVPVGGAA
jgi:hypothetical protein